MRQHLFLGLFLACSLTILSGCESAEERAEKHYQVALEHIETGDFQRAKVEFKNVFKLNGQHKEARLTYARMQREQGALQEAYSQYLRLVEQYPNNLEGQSALAEMAISMRNWEEVERHGKIAIKLAPDDSLVQSIGLTLAFRAAVMDNDLAAQERVLTDASNLVQENPEQVLAHRLIISNLIVAQNWDDALTAIDTALLNVPDAKDLYSLRLGVLGRFGDTDRIEAHLKDMIARFPEEQNLPAMLVQSYIKQGNLNAAETFLREQVNTTNDKAGAISILVQFLVVNRGAEIAKAELDKVIESDPPNKPLFQSLRATLNFDSGKQDLAISEMEAILDDADASSEMDNVKITLSHMLFATGNNVGARALVEEVLERDKTHVDALKLKAEWLIRDDNTGDAIIALRTALGQSPRDPEIMTLMAWVHERDGNKGLVGEMLALAVEASGSAPKESLRYAQYLIDDGKYPPAESILREALSLQPSNTDLLNTLGQLYLSMKDWGRVDRVIQTLEKLDTPNAKGMANELTTRKLGAQERFEELSAFLENMSNEGGDGESPDVALIRAQLIRGDTKAALSYANSLLAKMPSDPKLRILRALVLISANKFEEAEQDFTEILVDNPQNEQAWLSLYRIHRSKDDKKAAANTLNDARIALPNSPNLKWIAAGELEKTGDIDGAISLYEELYSLNSNSVTLANNLASLLSTHLDDPESLKRARTISRRLRGSKLPHFQDTYGWIALRLGNAEEALTYLQPAALGLPEDPAVQFHLAMAYAALNRDAEALAQFEKTSGMINQDQLPAYADTLTSEIKRLSNSNTQAGKNNEP